MDSVADLGLRVDYGDVNAASGSLRAFSAEAAAARAAAAALQAVAMAQSQGLRAAAQAIVTETQATIASTRAKADQNRALAANESSAQRAALARGRAAQQDDYALRLESNLAKQLATLSTAQDQATAAIERYSAAQSAASTTAAAYATRLAANDRIAQQSAARNYSTQFQVGMSEAFGATSPAQQANTTASRAQDIEAYAAALDNTRRQFDPLYAASRAYEEQLDRINAAERNGALSAIGATAARERERLAFEAEAQGVSVAANRLSGQSRFALTNLSYQINDVVSGLLMGQSPFQILTQQGGQFVQIMQNAEGGPSGLLRDLKNSITGFLTPARLMGGALLAGAAAFAVLAYAAIKADKELEAALTGTGRAAGVTAGQLDDMAVHAAQSGNISISAARSYAEAYASSGRVSGTSIEKLTAITEDYAATTHETSEDALKELVSSFSDLSTGSDVLNKKTGALDAVTRQHIIDLENQGQHALAVKAAYDALRPSLVSHTEKLSELGRVWATISKFGGDVAAGAETFINPTTTDKLHDAQAQLAQVKANGGLMALPGGGFLDTAEAQRQVDTFSAQLVRDFAKAGKDSHEQFLRSLAITADDMTKVVLPGIAQIQDLLTKQSKLGRERDLGYPGMSPEQAANSERAFWAVTGAAESLGNAQGDLIVSGQRYISSEQLQTKSLQTAHDAIYAKTAAQTAAIARQESLNSTVGSSIPPQERLNLANLAAKNAYDATIKSLSDQNLALNYNAQGILKVAQAYLQGDIPATIAAAAHAQALTEAISSGINVRQREAQLILEATANKVSSASQDVDTLGKQVSAQRDATAAVMAGTVAYDQIGTYSQRRQRDIELEDLRSAALATHNDALVSTMDRIIAAYKVLDPLVDDYTKKQQVLGLINPHAQDLTNLNTAAGMGLTPTQQGVLTSKTGLNSDVQGIRSDMAAANPFGASGQGGVQGGIIAAQQEQANRLQTVQDGLQAGLIKSEEDAAAMRVQINQDAALKIQQAYNGMYQAQLQMGADAFSSLAEGVGSITGKTSAAYRTLFAISKAFAIAQATLNLETAIGNAFALPWPANIPAIAAAITYGGTILSDIGSITASFADGVVGVSGPGTGRSDSINARISRGESVITADGTKGNVSTLTAMNNGVNFDDMFAGGMGMGAPIVQLIHDGSTAVHHEKTDDSRIVLIARQVLHAEGADVVAASQRDNYGIMAKATRDTMLAKRRRH